MTVTVTISPADLAALVASNADIAAAAAEGAAQVLRDAWTDRSMSTPDRPGGWAHTGYWQDASESVSARPEGDHALVSADKEGVRLHWRGGIVRPVNARRLAIPLRPEVQGVNPREGTIRDLFVIASKKAGRAVLAGKGAGGKVRAYWLLLSSTTHLPDSSVVPLEDMAAAAADWARDAALAPK